MAKVSYQLIPPEFDKFYSKALKSNDRFYSSSVRRNPLFTSVSRMKGLTQLSLIPVLSPVWNAFSAPDKADWDSAGAMCGYSGFKLFIQETSYRIKNSLSGYGTPSLTAQSKVGAIFIDVPDDGIMLAQFHPFEYWVNRKVRGTRNQYENVLVRESFGLPLTITISYKNDMVQTLPEGHFSFVVAVQSNYQGTIIENIVSIPFDFDSTWKTVSATLDHVKGYCKGYTAYLIGENVTGLVQFDNVSIEHSGHNWARDFRCNDINQEFTRAFYQVPKHWAPIIFGDYSFYDSIYRELI